MLPTALARRIAAEKEPRFITIPPQRRGGKVPFTEEQLAAMRGGLMARRVSLEDNSEVGKALKRLQCAGLGGPPLVGGVPWDQGPIGPPPIGPEPIAPLQRKVVFPRSKALSNNKSCSASPRGTSAGAYLVRTFTAHWRKGLFCGLGSAARMPIAISTIFTPVSSW